MLITPSYASDVASLYAQEASLLDTARRTLRAAEQAIIQMPMP